MFDWALVDQAPPDAAILLAGGLTPDNVGQAIDRVQPWGVDVSTGVEQSPAARTPCKVKAFIEAARAAAPVAVPGPGRAARTTGPTSRRRPEMGVTP